MKYFKILLFPFFTRQLTPLHPHQRSRLSRAIPVVPSSRVSSPPYHPFRSASRRLHPAGLAPVDASGSLPCRSQGRESRERTIPPDFSCFPDNVGNNMRPGVVQAPQRDRVPVPAARMEWCRVFTRQDKLDAVYVGLIRFFPHLRGSAMVSASHGPESMSAPGWPEADFRAEAQCRQPSLIRAARRFHPGPEPSLADQSSPRARGRDREPPRSLAPGFRSMNREGGGPGEQAGESDPEEDDGRAIMDSRCTRS